MTKRSPEQTYALLRQAGFSDAGAITMTAIAGAESNYNDASLGDLGLQTGTWGPSYGLFQIRTLKAQTGTGSNRDQTWLAASDLNQAKAAFAISGGGVNFAPWSTYTHGQYQAFLSGAKAAAGAVGNNLGKFVDSIGHALANPVGAVQGAATSTVDAVITPLLEGGRQLGMTALFATLGGLLLIGGLVLFAYPTLKEKSQEAVEVAKSVAGAVPK